MKANLVPEAELEEMICAQVVAIKTQYPCWSEPEVLCEKLGIQVRYGSVGLGKEGAAFADAILLDPAAGVPARCRFTFYHEIVHHLLRKYAAELYSIIHDQYESDELLTKISERLCNVGAAGFLLPRDTVRALYQEKGFSVILIESLSRPGGISRVAALAQLAFCAPHSCIAVVCRKGVVTRTAQGSLRGFPIVTSPREVVKIDVAFRSKKMKYNCAPGTEISSSHLLAKAFEAASGERIQGTAPIPFKSGRLWEVICEAIRFGEQVFAFFHVDMPPVSTHNQLRFPF